MGGYIEDGFPLFHQPADAGFWDIAMKRSLSGISTARSSTACIRRPRAVDEEVAEQLKNKR